MNKVEKENLYRNILQKVVEMHAQMPSEFEQPESIPICDTVHDNYLLMDVGWDATGRAYDVVFHLRLKDGKVLIETDGIEYGIAQDLIEAGIAKEDIIIAFADPQPKTLLELAA
jgi:hypothetical protein